jgi:hypothetical protein
MYIMKISQLDNLLVMLLISVMQLGLAACASLGFSEKYPMHSFSFDTHHDSPDAEVLDYDMVIADSLVLMRIKKGLRWGRVFHLQESLGQCRVVSSLWSNGASRIECGRQNILVTMMTRWI